MKLYYLWLSSLTHQHHLQRRETLTFLKDRLPFAFKQPEVFAVIIVATECIRPLKCSRRWVGLVNETLDHSISQLLPHTVVKCVMLSWQNIKIICKMNKNVTRYRDNRKLGNKYAGSCILNCFVLSSPSLSSFTFKSSFSKHTVNAL